MQVKQEFKKNKLMVNIIINGISHIHWCNNETLLAEIWQNGVMIILMALPKHMEVKEII